MNSSTSCRFSCRTPRATRPAWMLRRTVSHGKRFGSWKTSPRSALGAVIGSEPIKSSPESGRSRPAIRRRRVDFPQPLGPTSETNSPAASDRETASRASRRASGSSGRGKALADLADPQRRAFRGGNGYHLITPFCQTRTRSRTLKSTVMIVEKNAAMTISAAKTLPYSAQPWAHSHTSRGRISRPPFPRRRG